MKHKVSEDKIKTMMKKYCRPENCEALAPVPVNLAVWKCISKRTQQTDIALQRNQGIICKGLVPLLTVLDDMLGKTKMGNGLSQQELVNATKLVKDTFVFMQMAYADMNVKRRNHIKSDLHPSYQSLCSDKNPITQNLFGDDIDGKIKEVDIANKLGNRIGKFKSKGPGLNIGTGRGRSKPYERPPLDLTLRGMGIPPFRFMAPMLPQVGRHIPFLGNRRGTGRRDSVPHYKDKDSSVRKQKT